MTTDELLALAAAGGALAIMGLVDLFVTVFAFDGFTFLSPRLHRAAWSVLRALARLLPPRARDASLSIGSALLIPGTLAFWLAIEITAFAMIYLLGIDRGSFAVASHAGRGIGSAFYLSGGDLTSLTFGDFVPRAGAFRALVDLETVIGLSMFTLGLTYVLSAFDAMSKLERLYARVRRNAVEPNQPSTVLARRLRGGDASRLADLLHDFVEDLEDYESALRRYPVSFYFHTRRHERSTPHILAALGELVELTRWGLPPTEEAASDPALLALMDGYQSTIERLRRSFVGPEELADPSPERICALWQARDEPGSPGQGFLELQRTAWRAAGLGEGPAAADSEPESGERFAEWLVFRRRRGVLLDELSRALGYEAKGGPDAELAHR